MFYVCCSLIFENLSKRYSSVFVSDAFSANYQYIERLGDFALQRTKHLNLVNPHIPSSEVVLLKKCYTEKVEQNEKK